MLTKSPKNHSWFDYFIFFLPLWDDWQEVYMLALYTLSSCMIGISASVFGTYIQSNLSLCHTVGTFYFHNYIWIFIREEHIFFKLGKQIKSIIIFLIVNLILTKITAIKKVFFFPHVFISHALKMWFSLYQIFYASIETLFFVYQFLQQMENKMIESAG